jgi:hypothetical protein
MVYGFEGLTADESRAQACSTYLDSVKSIVGMPLMEKET